MDRTTTVAAQRRVGAAAVLAFVALLVLGLARAAAGADPATPAGAPAATATPQQVAPQGGAPFIPHRYRHYGGGAPAPSTGGAPGAITS